MFHNGFLISRVWLNKINTPLSESQMKALILRLTCMINSLPGQQKSSTHWKFSKRPFYIITIFLLRQSNCFCFFLLNNDRVCDSWVWVTLSAVKFCLIGNALVIKASAMLKLFLEFKQDWKSLVILKCVRLWSDTLVTKEKRKKLDHWVHTYASVV